MTSQKKAYLFALSAIFCWSTIASAMKLSLRYLDFYQILFISTITSTFLLFLIILFQNKLRLLKSPTVKGLQNSSFLGLINPFLYYIVLLKAYSLLKAQEAGTLNYIWPITLVLLSIPLLKQKISWLSIIAIVISFFGIIVISTEGNILSLQFKEPLGVLLAVGSSVFWALYWIYNVKDKRDEVIKLFWNFLFGSIYVTFALFLFSNFQVFQLKGLLGGIYIGIFEMGIAYLLWMYALKNSSTTALISNLVYLSPFISLMIINILVKEKILFTTIIGLIFIIAGILLQQLTRKKQVK